MPEDSCLAYENGKDTPAMKRKRGNGNMNITGGIFDGKDNYNGFDIDSLAEQVGARIRSYFLYQPSLGLWINETSIMANAEGIHFYPYLFKGWCTWFYGTILCRSPT